MCSTRVVSGVKRSRLFHAVIVAGASLAGSGCYLAHEPPTDAATDSSVADSATDTARDTAPLFPDIGRDTARDTGPDTDAGCTPEMCFCVDLAEHPECEPCGAPCIL